MSFLSPEFILQIVLGLFGAGGVSVFVGAWRDRRKADAEASREDATAADIIEGAAGRTILRMENENKEQRAEIIELQVVNRKLIAHIHKSEDWERSVVAVLEAANISVDPPPRLELE